MKRINTSYLLFFIISNVIFSSCIDINIRESTYVDFNGKGMTTHEEYTFYPFDDIDSKYSKGLFDLYVSLRYTEACKLNYLPLKIEFASLEKDSIKEKSLNIPLFDDRGNYKGRGNLGIYESEVILENKQPFEEGFFISISTSETDTEGIISLGIISKKVL